MDKQNGRLLPTVAWLSIAATVFVVGLTLLIGQPVSTAAVTLPISKPPATIVAPIANQNRSEAADFDTRTASTVFKVIGWNDLGMHCMQENYSNMAVLPPFNTVWAQVVRQGSPATPPAVITAGMDISYTIIDNTYSACLGNQPTGTRCKSNFWQFAPQLFPGSASAITPGLGLFGARLAGQMAAQPDHFSVVGIPLVPYLDSAPAFTSTNWYPYQRAHLVATDQNTGQVLAETISVAPVSTEMRCDRCHARGHEPGGASTDVEVNILTLHDAEEGTHLIQDRPVLCASCHGSNALGIPGTLGPDKQLSLVMHAQHAEPIGELPAGENGCYSCHPGPVTQCLRDVMANRHGLTCTDCHGSMSDVANTQRIPWKTLPRCETCHGAIYAEESGVLYRDSKGHGGLYCEACHGSPHAIYPTNQPNDNYQNIQLQGFAGTLRDCKVCHGYTPAGAGPHGIVIRTTFVPTVRR